MKVKKKYCCTFNGCCVASYLNRGREVFSQVKVVKCFHRKKMKQITLNNIKDIRLSCTKKCHEALSDYLFYKLTPILTQ